MAVISTNIITEVANMGTGGTACAQAFNTINDTFTALGVGSSSDTDASFASVTATGAIQGGSLVSDAGITAETTILVDADGSQSTAQIAVGNISGTTFIQFYIDSGTSALSLSGSTEAIIEFATATTGKNSLSFPNNLADALSVTDAGATDYIVFTSTTNGKYITLGSTTVGVRTQRVESIPDATTSETVTVADSGRVYVQLDADEAVTFQLPATQNGLIYTFVCGHAGGEINISPNAADKITGKGIAGADNQDIKNTNASNAIGDCITLIGDGVDGWLIINMLGTWATV